jgi:hypothetical protein
MKTKNIFTNLSLSLSLSLVLLGNSLFSQAPAVHWKTIDHAPINFWTAQPQTHENSGEDWWYDLETSYSESEIQNGYATCGYATWVNNYESEIDDHGCFEEQEGDYRCHIFEHETTGKLGSSRGTIALYDLEGKMVWCRAPNSGVLNSVKQLDDKSGYIATGWTKSTLLGGLGGVYNGPLLNNPTATNSGFNFADNCNQSLNWGRKLNIVKTDNEGNIIWNFSYSHNDAFTDLNKAYETNAEGFDIEEVSDGFLVVGYSNNYNYVLKTNQNGEKIWEVTYNIYQNGMEGFAKSIDSYNGEFVIGGDETYYPSNYNNAATGFSYVRKFNSEVDIQTQNFSWQNIYRSEDYQEFNEITNKHFRNFDVEFDNNGNIIFPLTVYRNIPFQGHPNSKGIGIIFKLNKNNGNNLLPSNYLSIGDIAAFDLMVGVTATSDNGFAVVSSKQPFPVNGNEPDIDEIMDVWVDNTDCNVFNIYGPNNEASPYNSWNTDAYVAKFDANANLEWEKTFDVHDGPREAFPGDLKKQECMYNIVQAQDGGLVICGNNSRNFDDNYLVKLHDDCGFTAGVDYDINPLAEEEAENEFFVISTANNNSPYTISSNTKIKAHIIVGDGGILRITNGAKVEFADSKQVGHQSRITVEEDGSLDIISGTLTSLEACPNAMWDGVNVLGNPYIEQDFNGQHGYVGMADGATIENARVAVLADHVTYDSEMNFSASPTHDWAGGIVQSNGATIRNSRNGIIFYPFEFSRDHPNQTISEIKNTTFITDAPLNGSLLNSISPEGVGTYGHLHIWDYHGLNLTGNTFDNQINFHPEQRGTGILSFDANFSVKCASVDVDGNCISGSNTFKNLTFGVEAHNIATIYNHDIDGNNFENCRFAIAGYNTWLSRYVRNNIEMEGITYNSGAYSHYGIMQYGSELFKIEENTITNPNQTIVNGGGIYVNNSNNSADEIYRNTIEYANTGLHIDGQTSYNSNEGLSVKCNQFQGDGSILNYSMLLGTGTIFENQGLCQGANQNPAANILDNCGTGLQLYDFEIYSTSVSQGDITYHHSPNNAGVKFEPDCYENRLVLNPCAGITNYLTECPTKVNAPHPQGKTNNPEALRQLVADFYEIQIEAYDQQIEETETEQVQHYYKHQQGLVKKELFRNLIASNQTELLLSTLNTQSESENRLAQHALLTQNGTISEEAKLGVYPKFVDMVLEQGYPNPQRINDPLVEKQIRNISLAEDYGNLKAKSYLRLAKQEPIIPELFITNQETQNVAESPYEKISNHEKLLIFPNPTTTNSFTLTLPPKVTKGQVRIMNNLGQVIFEKDLFQPNQEIQIPNAAQGMYFISVSYLLEGKQVVKNQKLVLANE